VDARDGLAREVLAIAGLEDLDVLEHLPHDDLDVLVVHADALAPVDLLDLVDQVRLNGLRAARLEQDVGVDAAAGQRVARLDALAGLDDHADVAVDAVRLDELAVVRRHGDAGLVLVLLDGHDAVELTDDGLDLGLAGRDELDHARQTLRDVGA